MSRVDVYRMVLADDLAQYITDSREEEDFQDWCFHELNSKKETYTLDERHDNHVFVKAKLFLHLSGYDITPYSFTNEFLEGLS